MKTAILSTLLILFLSICISAQADAAHEKAFAAAYDAYIQSWMTKMPDIPGLAVVVVKDGKTIFAKGYGYADRERNIKADANTLFYLGSSTKSFTGLAAALIDRDGKIKLADPLNKYLHGIEMKTPLPDKITVRDLLTHTSALRNPPLTFRLAFSGDSEPKEMVLVFAGATTFDDKTYGTHRYTNLGYNIYGLLLQNELKQKWQDVLQKRVFDPLGMRHTTAYPSRAASKKWTLAQGYIIDEGTSKIVRSPLGKTDENMQSAGGIFASISDIGRWLAVNMNDGMLDGKQVMPAEVMREVHTGYTKTTRNAPFPGDGQYGLGWQIGEYKKNKVIYHPGGFTGYSSDISFLPEKKIGVSVLVNNDLIGNRVGGILTQYAFDWWNGETDVEANYAKQLQDTVDVYPKKLEQLRGGVAERAKRTSQLTLPLDAYAGRYENEFWGTMVVTPEANSLRVKIGNISYLATPYTQSDTIRVELIAGTGEVIKFNRDGDKITGLNYGDALFPKR